MKSYLKANPGAPFIVAFVILLVSAATLLTLGESITNDFANYAFFALIVGIALQLVVVIREGRKHSRPRNSNSSGHP